MGKKISKKDRLDAMLQMWILLREINRDRPFASTSNDHKIMISLQTELAKTLGVPAALAKTFLQKPEIEALIERLKRIRENGSDSPVRTALALDSIIEQLKTIIRKEPATPEMLLTGDDVAEAPTSNENEEQEPETPQPEEDEHTPDEDSLDSF